MGLLGGLLVKNLSVNAGDRRRGFNPWVRKIPWRWKWQPTPVFMPGKSHGPRSLVGYSPWGHKELDNNNIILFVSYLCQEISKFQLLYLPLTSGPGWLVGWFSHYVVSDSCDPMDFSLPGFFANGILQARILEWVAISISRGSS